MTRLYENDSSFENFTNVLGHTTMQVTLAPSEQSNFRSSNFTEQPDVTSTEWDFSNGISTALASANLTLLGEDATFTPPTVQDTPATTPNWWQELNVMISIVQPVIYGTICFCGIIGNLLVILVLLRYSSMKTLPNIYILNLATADFLFMLTIPFVAYQFVTEKWIFGYVMCKFVMSFDGMNQFTGVFLLTAMSLDRYMAFSYPIKSLLVRTLRNTRIICILMWVLSGVVCLPLWIYSGMLIDQYTNATVCTLTWTESVHSTFILYAFTLGYVIPLLIISTCYISIIRLISKNKQPGEPGLSKRGSRRVAVLVIMAVLTFAFCWLPFYVMQIKFAFFPGPYTKAAAIATLVSMCLSYSNSALNPIVYTFVGRNFKESIGRLVCCKGDMPRKAQSAYLSSSRNKLSRQLMKGLSAKKYISKQSPEPNIHVLAYHNAAYQISVSDNSPSALQLIH
ncbi:somatostatin receptor type 2-like [Ptychodera flava]|uniref:somatostatin receptor type 2-like n=1 Tax=Ptychodera flava TaxID=63121 RepID=UPI00396A809E